MSDDRLTASGGMCASLGVHYGEDGGFSSGGFLPPIQAVRGKIEYLPESAFDPYVPPPLWQRRVRRARVRSGAWLHALARWVGDEPPPEPWDD